MGALRRNHSARAGVARTLVAMVGLLGAFPTLASAGGPPPPPDRVFREGGLKYVMTRASSGPATDAAGVEVPCRGKRWRVVGGGVQVIQGFAPAVFVSSSHPFDLLPFEGGDADLKPDDGWDVFVREEAGPDLELKGWAICAKRAGLRYRSDTSEPAPGTGETATAGCRGDLLLGGGFFTSPVLVTETSVARPYDGGDPGSRPDDGWTVHGFNHSGSTSAIGATAICSTKGGARYRTKAASAASAPTTQSPRARCPGGSHATGGGGSVGSGHIVESYPVDRGDRDRAPDDAWQTTMLVGTGFAARTHVVCGK